MRILHEMHTTLQYIFSFSKSENEFGRTNHIFKNLSDNTRVLASIYSICLYIHVSCLFLTWRSIKDLHSAVRHEPAVSSPYRILLQKEPRSHRLFSSLESCRGNYVHIDPSDIPQRRRLPCGLVSSYFVNQRLVWHGCPPAKANSFSQNPSVLSSRMSKIGVPTTTLG